LKGVARVAQVAMASRRHPRARTAAAAAALAGLTAVAALAAAATAVGPALLGPARPRQRGVSPAQLCGRSPGPRAGRHRRQPPRSAVEVAGLGSLWEAIGIGPVAAGAWARLAVFPPFSWAQWLAVQFVNAPAFYRYYIYYTLGNALAKRLVPGLHAQLFTGTTLGLLKTVSADRYADAVAGRLRDLLIRQASLGVPRGQRAPQLPPAVLEAAMQRLKEDKVLTEALGSTAALAVWHKLERTPLNDPALLQDYPPDSQARWLLEALRAGYTGDLEEAARSGAVTEAAKEAVKALRALDEAVDAVALNTQHGILEAGGAGGLAEVEKASSAAAEAMAALEKARAEDPRAAAVGAERRSSWEAKLAELRAAHAATPAVATALQRLAPAAEPAAGADNVPLPRTDATACGN